MRQAGLWLVVWALAAAGAFGQADSAAGRPAPLRPGDSLAAAVPMVRPARVYNPRTATLRSLAVPGWGQAYVRQYWTIPIIYAGYGTLIGIARWNHVRYRAYRTGWQLLLNRFAKDSTLNKQTTRSAAYGRELTQDQLSYLTSAFRRQRDLTFIGLAALHALQTVEANVTAHLKTFDDSDDISLHLRPGSLTDFGGTPLGLTLVVRFEPRQRSFPAK